MYTRILVATDLSDCADAALLEAADLAHRQGGELHVCTALGSPREPVVMGSVALQQQHLEADIHETQQRLRQKLTAMGFQDIEHRVHVFRHLPGEEVPRAAWRLDCDLIVICSKGGSDTGRFGLGSVAEHILANARVPVLVVPPSVRVSPTTHSAR